MSVPRVLAVGSCRIFRPLRTADEKGHLELVNKIDTWWFTHTTAGALQYVEVLAGRRDVPHELRQVTCETMIEDLPDDLSAPHLLEVDAVVVEVSTMRQLLLGPTHLNHQRVWGHVNNQGLAPAPVLGGITSALPEDDILKGLTVDSGTPESLVTDLRAIQALVAGAPVVTVDHLHAPTPQGPVAAERVRISEILAEVEHAEGLRFWSTASYIDLAGPSSLQDQNHWASSAEEPVGDRLAAAVASVL